MANSLRVVLRYSVLSQHHCNVGSSCLREIRPVASVHVWALFTEKRGEVRLMNSHQKHSKQCVELIQSSRKMK